MAVGPNALATRLTNPPGMSSAQLSTSIVRANAARIVAPSTNHGAGGPSSVRVTPAMKNAATPQLRDSQGRGLSHRHKGQERGRRQDDADGVTGWNG
jgi:hypothetical protein